MSSFKSLSESIQYVFGSPLDSFESLANLPTCFEVTRRYMAIFDTERADDFHKNVSEKSAVLKLSQELIQFWENRSSQPVKSLRQVEDKITKVLLPKVMKVKKNLKPTEKFISNKISEFSVLFDISQSPAKRSRDESPDLEDVPVRNLNDEIFDKNVIPDLDESDSEVDENDSDYKTTDDEDESADFEYEYEKEKTRSHIDYPNFSNACVRFNLSTYATMVLLFALLKDLSKWFNIPAYFYPSQKRVITIRKKSGEKLNSEHHNKKKGFFGVKIDGKKSETAVGRGKTKCIENVTAVSYPGGEYLENFSPVNGSGRILALETYNLIEKYEAKSFVCFVGADGCGAMTGPKKGKDLFVQLNSDFQAQYIFHVISGFIANLEILLGFSVLWVICLLHFIQSPFKHLMIRWDGETKDPISTSGPIGTAIRELHNNLKPFVDVLKKKIKASIPVLSDSLLANQDVKNLYRLCQMITTGVVDPRLEKIVLPTIHNARWLTHAIRILRLYLQEENPSLQLKKVSKFIVQWLAVMHFKIILEPSVTMAAVHFHSAIVLARDCLTKVEFKFVQQYFTINSFMAHPESILLAMLFDKNPVVRKKAVDTILLARKKKPGKKIRKFVVPNLKFQSTTYYEMIDWNKVKKITEPAPIRKFTNEQLKNSIYGEDLNIGFVPNHSTDNERAIQTTAQIVKKAKSAQQQKEFILKTNASRKLLPLKISKKDYFSQNHSGRQIALMKSKKRMN